MSDETMTVEAPAAIATEVPAGTEAQATGAPEGAATAATTEPAIAPDVTHETLKEAAKRRDVNAVREQFNKIRGKGKPTEKKAEPQPAVKTEDTKPADKSAEPAAKPAAEKETAPKGKYVIGDGIEKIELDDPDGFLGHKNTEGMKKAMAHQIRRIKMDKQWLSEAEQKASAALVRAEQEAARRAELEAEVKRLKELVTKQTATTESEQATARQMLQIPDPPKAPEPPDYNVDDYEEHEKEYKIKRAEYERAFIAWTQDAIKKTAEHAQSLIRAGVQIDNEHPIVKDIMEMKKNLAEIQQAAQEVKKTKEQLEIERKQNQYWADIEDFLALHPEEKPPVPMKELHKQIWENGAEMTWMDWVARANGVSRPVSANRAEWDKYWANRLALTQRYLDNDKEVVSKCEAAGVEPPEGYKEYFNAARLIKEIDDEHRRLIEQGLLGAKSTRQMAWEIMNKGKLTNQIREMERKALSNGASTVVNALTKHIENDAVVIPPELPQSGSTPISDKQIAEMLKQTAERARDPEFAKTLRETIKKARGR